MNFANKLRSISILAAGALLFLLAACLPVKAQATATVKGVVKNASGKPVEGAFVRIRSLESGIVFMVVSQAQGRYSSPNLLPGKYMIEGVGGEYQSDPAGPVEAGNGQPAQMDVVLSVARKATPPRQRITQSEFAAAMPEGPAKQLILTKCVSCHDLTQAYSTEGAIELHPSRAEVEETIGVHQYYTGGRPEHLSDDEAKLVVDYLSQNFNREGHPVRLPVPSEKKDPDINHHLPRTLAKGVDAKYVVVDFPLGKYHTHDITADSQGIAWLGEHSEDEFVGAIGRFDPKTFSYTHVVPPAGKATSTAQYLGGTRVDPQGVIWSTDNGHNARVVSYDPKTSEFRIYDVPAPPRIKELSLASSSNINTLLYQDGFLWGSGLLSSQIYKIDPVSGGVITYPTRPDAPAYGMAFDKNKMLWYAAEYSDQIVKLDPATGKQTVYKVLTPHPDLRHIQIDNEGNAWAGAEGSDKLVRVDAHTGEVTEYEPPTKFAGIDTLDVDRKHDLIWIAEDQAEKLARFNPRTNTFEEFSLASPVGVKRISVDPTNPNRVWWCTGNTPGSSAVIPSNRAGYVEVLEATK